MQILNWPTPIRKSNKARRTIPILYDTIRYEIKLNQTKPKRNKNETSRMENAKKYQNSKVLANIYGNPKRRASISSQLDCVDFSNSGRLSDSNGKLRAISGDLKKGFPQCVNGTTFGGIISSFSFSHSHAHPSCWPAFKDYRPPIPFLIPYPHGPLTHISTYTYIYILRTYT